MHQIVVVHKYLCTIIRLGLEDLSTRNSSGLIIQNIACRMDEVEVNEIKTGHKSNRNWASLLKGGLDGNSGKLNNSGIGGSLHGIQMLRNNHGKCNPCVAQKGV
jgi:hypothetical protein